MSKYISFFTFLWASHALASSYSIIENVECKPESDVCETKVKVLKDGVEVSEIVGLEGPVFHSAYNSQILSCESNAVFGTSEIRVFSYAGEELFSYPHLGYQRDCGVMGEAPLYWFLYNTVVKDQPRNSLVVLNLKGEVVLKTENTVLTVFEFSYKNMVLSLTTPAPDWPG